SAVNGVATFSSVAIATDGTYSLTATDSALPAAVSDTFHIGLSAFDNFNGSATSFTGPFATNNSGRPGGASLTWGPFAGIADQSGGTAGGGIVASAGDETAVYTPAPFNLSDGAVHTVAEFLTSAAGYASGDRLLQIGLVTSPTGPFNKGFSFL